MKPCKLCSKPRYANLTICYSHYKEGEKAKRLEKLQKKLERKVKSKKFQKSEFRKWHTKAWDAQSLYRRKSAANFQDLVECYTCRKMVHWKYKGQLGHFHHNKADFEPRNLHIQCDGCNGPQGGNLASYATRLVQEIGQEGMVELEKYANTKIYSLEELKEIYLKFTELLKSL